jgi:hypothetical protein
VRSLDRIALCALGLVVVALAWRPSGEFSAWLAFDIADRQPWGSILGRTYLAAPVHALSFRPGSVALLKGLAALGTPLDPWLQALEALLVLPFLAVARRWGIERLGLPGPAASAAAGLALLTPAGLFNAWHLGELDLLGAALLLGGDLLLRRARDGAGAAPAVALFAAAVLLKDSVAVLALVALAAQAWEARADEGTWDTLPSRVLAGCVAALAMLFLRRPEWGRLIGGPVAAATPGFLVGAARAAGGPGGPGGPSPAAPAVVALAQLVALVGPVSVGAWLARDRRLPAWGATCLAVLAVLAPEPARFHVYLSVVYASVPWVLAVGTFAVIGLGTAPERPAARLALGGVAAFVVLPLVLRMRGDLSTRVLLPLAAPLFGLAVAAVLDLARRGRRLASAALALGLLWQGVGGAWDFGARFLTLERVELRAKRSLVGALHGPTWLFATHRAWLVHPDELAGLGAPDDLLLRRPAVPFAVDRPDGRFPGAPMRRVLGTSAPELVAAGEQVLLYEVGLRSRDGVSALRGSFRVGPGAPWPVPPHSFEDDHYRVYSPGPAADGLLAGEGTAGLLADWHLGLRLPPPRAARLTEALLWGVPLSERMDAVGRVSTLGP